VLACAGCALLTSCRWPGGGKEESLNVNDDDEEEAAGEEACRSHMMPQGHAASPDPVDNVEEKERVVSR